MQILPPRLARLLVALVLLTASSSFALPTQVYRWQPNSTWGVMPQRSLTFSDRWDFIVPIDDSGRVLLYSRAAKLMKLIRFNSDGSYSLLRTKTNVGGLQHEQVVAGNFGGANVAMYNRNSRQIEFWRVTTNIITKRTTYGTQIDAEGLVAGDWDASSPGDELLAYDKFKGKLSLIQTNSISWAFNNFFHIYAVAYVGDFAMNFEKMATHDWDGDGEREVWFHNSDDGSGMSVKVAPIVGVVADSRTVLPASPGNAHTLPVVVPKAFGARDALMVYRRDCNLRTGDCQGKISFVERKTNGQQDAHWRSGWNDGWTHIVPFRIDADGPTRLLLYSHEQRLKTIWVKLNNPSGSAPVRMDEDFADELKTQLNLSYAPAGINVTSDGKLRNLNHNSTWDWCMTSDCADDDEACEQANTECENLKATAKPFFALYSDFLSRSQCVACVEHDSYCRDTNYDSWCRQAFTGRCGAVCTTAPKDQVTVFVHRHGQGFASIKQDYIMLPDKGTNLSKRVYTDGSVRNRFGELQPNSSLREQNYKIHIHEFGHFFGLCHSHFHPWKKTATDLRSMDGELTQNKTDWFISRDTVPKASDGRTGGCCPAGQANCDKQCWLSPAAINYCSDLPIRQLNKNGASIFVNSDRTQPMGYGGDCNGIYRFSPAQILNLHAMKMQSYSGTMPERGRSYLFE